MVFSERATAGAPGWRDKRSEGWNLSAGRTGWESWGCSAWGREGCEETLEQLPVPGGAAREMERGW